MGEDEMHAKMQADIDTPAAAAERKKAKADLKKATEDLKEATSGEVETKF